MDYWKLNKVTRKEHFSLSFIVQMINRLVGQEFYYFLDEYSRYNQIAIHPKDHKKTTFACLHGTFVFKKDALWSMQCAQNFHRCMMSIFLDMIENGIKIYMDDFSILKAHMTNDWNPRQSFIDR